MTLRAPHIPIVVLRTLIGVDWISLAPVLLQFEQIRGEHARDELILLRYVPDPYLRHHSLTAILLGLVQEVIRCLRFAFPLEAGKSLAKLSFVELGLLVSHLMVEVYIWLNPGTHSAHPVRIAAVK